MRWPGFLSRARRSEDPVAAAEPDLPPAFGMNYLRARAGLDFPSDAPPASSLLELAAPDATPAEATQPEAAQPDAIPPDPPPVETGAPDEAITCETFIRQAEEALARGDWAGAEQIWRAVRTVIPQFWYSYTGGAAALRGLGRYDEAKQLLAEAAVLVPQERAVLLEQGRLAMDVSDWPAAEAHWRAALTCDVRPWWVYTELAGALEHQGRLSEAEAVLLEARLRCDEPEAIALYILPGLLAWKREDWAAAVTYWAEARQRFPDNEEFPGRHHEALMRLAEHDPVAHQTAVRGRDMPSPADTDARAIVLRFESLGGTGPDGGCEFGCFQRAFDAEPLGLLRWAAVSPEALIAMLEARFARVGDADAMSVAPHEGQWEITDTVYGTKMHSFVSSLTVSADQMLGQASMRMRFLRDKLIADLDNPGKIFVLKSAWRPVTAAEIEALGRAIRRYGSGELLCVCNADAAHPEGDIVAAVPGIFIGYLDFSGHPDAPSRKPGWLALCRKMLGISDATARTPLLADAGPG
nr:hypothetical protein [uncultured Rhodopila sp.]